MGATGTYGPFFPYVVIVTHFLNIFFMLLLARSGLEVLAAFPKLYWNESCPPGREWLRFSTRAVAADSRHPWSSLDEEVSWSPVISLPGRKNLGLGRHWHFLSIQFWVLTGAVYVGWVFASGYWHYLVPTSWSIFPDAVRAVGSYLQFRYPPLLVIHGVPHEFAAMVFGSYTASGELGLAIGLTGIFLILVFHLVISWFSLHHRRATQRLLGTVVNPFERAISRRFTSRQRFTRADISPYHRVNGYPPTDPEYDRMAADDFREYRLPIGGLVENPMLVSLADLRTFGPQSQITKHNCIQGWTGIAEWAGVPLAEVVARVRPAPGAKTVVFYAFDDKGLTEGEGRFGHFYESIPLHLATNPQTLLVLEMNGGPLPVEHGGPVRVRIETQLGFKMVKWIKGVEFVDDVSRIGQGQGGWREDQQFYGSSAGI